MQLGLLIPVVLAGAATVIGMLGLMAREVQPVKGVGRACVVPQFDLDVDKMPSASMRNGPVGKAHAS